MTEIHQSIGIALLAGIAGAMLVGIVCAITYPRVRMHFDAIMPGLRSMLLLAILLLPLVTGIAFIGLILSPVLDYGTVLHHCHTDNVTGCVPHTMQALDRTPSTFLLLLGMALIAWPSVRLIGALRRIGSIHNSLRLGASYDEDCRCYIIDDPRPLAFTAGLFTPAVFITTGLRDNLDQQELKTVLEHERAHIQRRDTACLTLGKALSFGHTPRTTELLFSDLHLASEQACDEYASRQVGGRLIVAATIIKIERLCSKQPFPVPASACGITGSSVPARVKALIHPPRTNNVLNLVIVSIGTVSFALMVFLAAEPLHHLIESIL